MRQGPSSSSLNWPQIALGAAMFLLGVAVYALARSTPIWGLPEALHFPIGSTELFWVTGSIPTAAHVAALSLLTAGFLGLQKSAWIGCVAWTLVDIAFELGQHPSLAAHLLERFQGLEGGLLDRVHAYFSHGTFDGMDIAAAVLGGTAAFIIIRSHQRKRS